MFQALKKPTFARLYTARANSLLGDALTWLGLALLAVEFAGDLAPDILASHTINLHLVRATDDKSTASIQSQSQRDCRSFPWHFVAGYL
jgi:hypothetical protein